MAEFALLSSAANLEFDAGFTDNHEVALRTLLPDGTLAVNANLFHTNWKHQQVSAPPSALGRVSRRPIRATGGAVFGHRALGHRWRTFGMIGDPTWPSSSTVSKKSEPGDARSAAYPDADGALVATGHGDGFPASLDALYRRYFEKLVAYLRSTYGEGPPQPEDAAQQAFVKLAERGTLEDIERLPAFLWRTARNLVSTERRARSTETRRAADVATFFFEENGSQTDPERVLTARAQLAKVTATLRKMPATRRRVFLLNRIDGLSHAAVADRVGLSRSTVTKHIARATAEIEAVLGDR